MTRRLGILSLLTLLVAGAVLHEAMAYVAIVNKNDHQEMHVLPVPGKVTIDGDLKEWDLSGAILMFMDEGSKTIYSVRGALMYDKDFLYVGAQIKDPTPMVNNYTFGGEYNMSWNADAVQMRFLSFPGSQATASIQTGGHIAPEEDKCVNHLTFWYSTEDQKAGFFAMHTLGFADPELNPAGVEGAYKKDVDGKGYTMEYKVPWGVLRAPRPLAAGDTVKVQWQLHWGNDLGNAVRCGMTDVRASEGSDDLGYMGPRSWGKGIFEKTGNIKLTEATVVGRAQGHIPIAFKLEKGGKVSLAIVDARGKLVRTCLGAEPFQAGEQTHLWDGLDDYDRPVPADTYVARILTHDGFTQKFVCDVGVSGTPPHQTEDGTGGWAGDYGAPRYVATDGERVVLGTGSSEAAPGTICTDLEGKKKYGSAAAGGPLVLHKGFGYFLQWGSTKLLKFELEKGSLSPFKSGKPEMAILQRAEKEDTQLWNNRSWLLRALAAVDDSTLALSCSFENKILLIDMETGTVKGEAELKAPQGLAVDAKGTLYAISESTLGRYDLKSRQFTPIAANLDSPSMLACDGEGNVYASLAGKTMQVWKFNKDGKVLLKYGKEGGRPSLGKFDPAGMLNPYAIAVDKNGRLWVAEADGQPKRYSVWNADGKLYKDFFGSQDYATTAYVDPEAPEYVYAQGVRYRVDHDKGTWAPDATLLRERTEEGVSFAVPGSHPGAAFVNTKGRKFLVVGNGLTIYEVVKDAFVPRLCESRDAKANKNQLWIDSNNDGKVQAAEVQAVVRPWSYYWTAIVDKDLNLYGFDGAKWACQGGAKTTQPYSIVRWDFLGFNEQGGLKYGDPAKPTLVVTDPDGGSLAAWSVDEDGNIYSLVSGGSLERGIRAQGSGHRVVKFSPKGEKLWEYHNVHCAFAWASEAYTPGYVVGAICFARGLPAELVGITGYYGQYFLLDAKDGLFADALGEDQRSAYRLDQHMVLTENFNGTLFKHKNGKTYFLGGDADCRLWELTGLNTVKRETAKVKVTEAMVAKARDNARRNLEAAQAATGKKMARIARLNNAAADGKYDEWAPAPSVTIFMEEKRSATAQLGYDDKNLYVRFQVADESPLLNTPTDYKLLFKSGDAVEIQLGTALPKRTVRGQNQQNMAVGDLRLIMARTADGKMVATLYRYVTADKEKPNQASFETQSSGKDTLDEVVACNDLPMNTKIEKDGYVVEAAIPWASLGIPPKNRLALIGDLGVIYGNEGGTRNAIRYMWSDKSPEVSINNDIPSEIRIHPNQWGSLMLE